MQSKIAVVAQRPVIRAGLTTVLALAFPAVQLEDLDAVPCTLAGLALVIISELVLGDRTAADLDAPVMPLIITSTPREALKKALSWPLGVLSIHEDQAGITTGVTQGLAGQRHLPSDLNEALADEFFATHVGPPLQLTPREVAVMQHAASGQTADQIADSLYISTSTAKSHLHRVYGKLGVANRAAAVSRLMALGILAPPPSQSERRIQDSRATSPTAAVASR